MRADAERAESMEQTRLQGELEKSAKRLEALQAERAEEQRKAAEELAKVRAETADNDEQLKAIAAAKEQAEASAGRCGGRLPGVPARGHGEERTPGPGT